MTREEYYIKYLEKILSANEDEECPIQKTLELLSGKWRTHIIYELCRKPSCRFGELCKSVPWATNTMITSILRDLERIGIVRREQFNEIPPRVEYSLTEKGRALIPALYELTRWGEKYLDEFNGALKAQPKDGEI